jgi:hypothetical protein
VLQVLKGCCEAVTRVLQGLCKSVTGVSQGIKGVTKETSPKRTVASWPTPSLMARVEQRRKYTHLPSSFSPSPTREQKSSGVLNCLRVLRGCIKGVKNVQRV